MGKVISPKNIPMVINLLRSQKKSAFELFQVDSRLMIRKLIIPCRGKPCGGPRADESTSARLEVSYALVHLRSTRAKGGMCAIPRLASLGWGYLHLCRDAHDLFEAVASCLICSYSTSSSIVITPLLCQNKASKVVWHLLPRR